MNSKHMIMDPNLALIIANMISLINMKAMKEKEITKLPDLTEKIMMITLIALKIKNMVLEIILKIKISILIELITLTIFPIKKIIMDTNPKRIGTVIEIKTLLKIFQKIIKIITIIIRTVFLIKKIITKTIIKITIKIIMPILKVPLIKLMKIKIIITMKKLQITKAVIMETNTKATRIMTALVKAALIQIRI